MIKNTLVANEKVTLNDSKVTLLKEHFPSCFTRDGEFDIEKFRQIMVDNFTVINEGYGLQFLGKTYARYVSQLETETVIQPDVAHNKKSGNATSENIYISGDNIDALKHMLQSYEKSVKCIYIDPPYNTGSDDFAYTDDFKLTPEILQEKLSLTKEQAERVLDLTTRNSSSHSAWLMFMYPRLILARGLLKEDGVIFISIDDNEQANLKLICDEVFGEENYVNQFAWVSNITGRQISGSGAAKTWESVLVYAKNIDLVDSFLINVEFAKNRMSFTYKGFEKDIREDEYGKFAVGDTLYNHNRKFNEETRPNLVFSIFYNPKTGEIVPRKVNKTGFIEIKPHKNGDGTHKYHAWRWSDQKISNESYNLIVLPTTDGGYEIYTKIRDFTTTVLKDLITNISNGNDELQYLFGGKRYFSYPKSVDLMTVLLSSVSDPNALILDFFSGSATTAHAVMQMNVKDEADGKEGKRKYILVQLPEVVESNSEAEKAGFKTICDIGMARIEKAAEKIRNEYPETKVDLGFKHFTLEHLSQKTITELEHFDPNEQTLTADNSMLKKFGTPTVLATWLVRDSYGFTAVPQKLQLDSYEAYTCGHHLYLIDSDFSDKALVALCKKYEEDSSFVFTHVVVFGYSFTMTMLSALKANLQSYKDSEKNLNITFDIRY